MENKIQVIKVVSGGQTGVDRAGLDAAIELGINHDGYAPKGRKAEDGGNEGRRLPNSDKEKC